MHELRGRVAEVRLVCRRGLDNHLRHLVGALAVLVVRGGHGSSVRRQHRCVVGVDLGRSGSGSCGGSSGRRAYRRLDVGDELGAYGSGLDERAVDAEALHHWRQRLEHVLDRRLGTAVVVVEGLAHDAADARDRDDAAGACLAHRGQHGLGETHDAKVVDVEHSLRVGHRCLLERAKEASAGVVHQQIDAAVALEHACHACRHRLVALDVESAHVDRDASLSRSGIERRALGEVAHRGDDEEAGLDELYRRAEADTA